MAEALPVVKEDGEIEISFQLALLDGTVVEETEEGETLRFKLGDGTFLAKIESLLEGLELGTTGKFTLSPDDAFGASDPANVELLSRDLFPDEMVLEPGFVIGFTTPTGEEVPATILSLTGDEVEVDFNHPLAGHTVIFTATIQAIH